MSTMASQIIRVTIVHSTVCSGADERKDQRSLAFVRGTHMWPVNSPHRGPVTRKMFPCDDVIMISRKKNGQQRQLVNIINQRQCRATSRYCFTPRPVFSISRGHFCPNNSRRTAIRASYGCRTCVQSLAEVWTSEMYCVQWCVILYREKSRVYNYSWSFVSELDPSIAILLKYVAM